MSKRLTRPSTPPQVPKIDQLAPAEKRSIHTGSHLPQLLCPIRHGRKGRVHAPHWRRSIRHRARFGCRRCVQRLHHPPFGIGRDKDGEAQVFRTRCACDEEKDGGRTENALMRSSVAQVGQAPGLRGTPTSRSCDVRRCRPGGSAADVGADVGVRPTKAPPGHRVSECRITRLFSSQRTRFGDIVSRSRRSIA